MAVEVIFPPVALNAETGRLNRWLAAEGERVREGQPLFEIEADQAATEVEAPASGVLRGLRAKAGDRCRSARRSPGSSARTSRSIPTCRRSPASCARCWRRPRPAPQSDARPASAPARPDEADERAARFAAARRRW